MSTTKTNACSTERIITVGNINITIEFSYKLDRMQREEKRLYGDFKNEYHIKIESKFGKSSFEQRYAVTSNQLEDVVEYFRNIYRGKQNPWDNLVYIIPYSWE